VFGRLTAFRKGDPMNDVEHAIREFILNKYLPGESPENLREDTRLRTSGILDSLATLGLISFLEERFKIEVEAHETDIDNFDSLRDIVAFVERKMART
jgi:acyl carrier protein